jgi:hypothetical protein
MDNVAWQGDFEVHPLKGISLYGELFIDDMRTGELGTDYVGNKFAYLGGLFWVNPFGLENLDITAEYCRLDPFVYTHIYPINTYKNWNSSLGYFLPPNSERNFLGIRWHPDYCWTAILSACFVRYGANSDSVNVGGDIDLPPEVGITTAPFLAGKRINISTLEAMIKWEPLEYYSVTGYWRWHHWSGGYQNEWHFTIGVNVW